MWESLTVAAEEMKENRIKPLKNSSEGQATIDNDGQRNVGEWKLTAKNPMKVQAALMCHGSPMNLAVDHNKLGQMNYKFMSCAKITSTKCLVYCCCTEKQWNGKNRMSGEHMFKRGTKKMVVHVPCWNIYI